MKDKAFLKRLEAGVNPFLFQALLERVQGVCEIKKQGENDAED